MLCFSLLLILTLISNLLLVLHFLAIRRWNLWIKWCYIFLRWSLIAGRIPGRTAEEIEEYWNSRYSTSEWSCSWAENERNLWVMLLSRSYITATYTKMGHVNYFNIPYVYCHFILLYCCNVTCCFREFTTHNRKFTAL